MMDPLTDLKVKSKLKSKKVTLLQLGQASSLVTGHQELATTNKNRKKVSDWTETLNKSHKKNKNLMKDLIITLQMKI